MKRVLAMVLAAVLLCGCAGEKMANRTVFAMDTVMDLKIWGRDSEAALTEIQKLLTALEKDWSATDEDSVISALNRGETDVNAERQELLDRVQALKERTNGAFDPQLYALTTLWGFPTDEYYVPDQAEIDAAMQTPLWDLGAAVKGYAGQRAADMLPQMDVDRAILNMGGNVQTYGSKPDGSPWQVAIQNPDYADDYIGIVSVEGTVSIVTSGSYQRYFEEDGVRYHHILDPETGFPAASGLASVTVICRDGLTADALSTALFVMGLEDAIAFWRASGDFEAVFVLTTGEICATEGANLSDCRFEVISREN